MTGIVLTKLDGDARGGAALSIKSVVNRPIKFVGVGEKYADLDVFYPDRMASRILGMGDVLSLIEKVEAEVDQKEAARLAERVAKDKFTLEDLRSQLQQVKKMGPLSSLVSMIPGAGKISEDDVDEGAIVRMQAILDSMTKKEREFPQLLNGQRKKRIAKGSGTSVQEINRLLKQYLQMKKMMKSFSKGFGARKFGKMMKGLPPRVHAVRRFGRCRKGPSNPNLRGSFRAGSGTIPRLFSRSYSEHVEDSFAPSGSHARSVLPGRRFGLPQDAVRGHRRADRTLRSEEESGRRQDRPHARRLLGQQGRTALADREVAAQEASKGVVAGGLGPLPLS